MECFEANEGSGTDYTATIVDEKSVPIPLSELDSLTLTLYDASTGALINSRNLQNVKNAHNCTYAATGGKLTWYLQPGDNPVLGDPEPGTNERHIARFDYHWTNNTGSRSDWHKVAVDVVPKREFDTLPE